MTPSGSSSANRERPSAETPLLLLDANILLRAARPGFRWQPEAERLLGALHVAVPSSVLLEVDQLAARGVSGARAASAIARTFPSVPGPGEGDDAIVALAVRVQATVLTADRRLARRLNEAGLDALVPRDRTRLELRPALPVGASGSSARATVKKRPRFRTPVGVRPRRHARR